MSGVPELDGKQEAASGRIVELQVRSLAHWLMVPWVDGPACAPSRRSRGAAGAYDQGRPRPDWIRTAASCQPAPQTRLWFAGEATSKEDAYTVHGAYKTGGLGLQAGC